MQTWSAVHVPGVVSAGGLPNNSYTTSFAGTENPISESGVWVTGLTNGLDWTDVRETPTRGFGTESGSASFDDSIAHLKGTWANDQIGIAVCHLAAPSPHAGADQECEILLRFDITAHNARGYEFNYGIDTTGNGYAQIVRWNGAQGDFLLLDSRALSPRLADGDVVKATAVGTVLSTYRALAASPTTFVLIFSYDTSTGNDSGTGGNPGGPDSVQWNSGRPGIGFFADNGQPTTADYCWSSYTVTAS